MATSSRTAHASLFWPSAAGLATLLLAAALVPHPVADLAWPALAVLGAAGTLTLLWRISALRADLSRRARRDALTELGNQIMLAERLELLLAQPAGRCHGLLLLGLDGFGDLTDALGPAAGDQLLVAVAHRLREVVAAGLGTARLGATRPGTARPGMARLGDDEFAILIEDTDPATVYARGGQILAALRRPYSISGQEIVATASIGLLIIGADRGTMTASDALRDAALALSAAKHAGRDRLVPFHPDLRTVQREHSRLSLGLRRAVAGRELTVNYQPIVALAEDRLVAVEALLRWTPPEGHPVPPADFIPVAEETGIISVIGEWALRRACQDGQHWYRRRGVAISVNVSGRQLRDPGFADVVLDALRGADLPGPALIMEVTETALIGSEQAPTAVAVLDRLRRRGIRVALDDFGTGYSSLSYLAQLPIDIIKIDSSFVAHSPGASTRGWEFTEAILRLVAGLGLPAVTEGVETADQARRLRELGCQMAQGYLHGRPVPPAKMDDLVLAADEIRT